MTTGVKRCRKPLSRARPTSIRRRALPRQRTR